MQSYEDYFKTLDYQEIRIIEDQGYSDPRVIGHGTTLYGRIIQAKKGDIIFRAIQPNWTKKATLFDLDWYMVIKTKYRDGISGYGPLAKRPEHASPRVVFNRYRSMGYSLKTSCACMLDECCADGLEYWARINSINWHGKAFEQA